MQAARALRFANAFTWLELGPWSVRSLPKIAKPESAADVLNGSALAAEQ